MIKPVATIAVFALLVSVHGAKAACEDLLRYINYDTSRNYSSLTTEQIQTANLCTSEYRREDRNTAAQIEASYNLFSGKAGGTDQEIKTYQTQRCGGKYGKDYLQNIGVAATQIVSPAATAALEVCYKTRSNSFFLDQLMFSGDRLVADFKYAGAGKIIVSGYSFDNTKADCTLAVGTQSNVAGNFELPSGEVISLKCTRKSSRIKVGNDEDMIVYEASLVTVASNAGSVSIPLSRVTESLVPSSRLNVVESKLSALKSDVAAAAANLKIINDALSGRLSALEAAGYKVVLKSDGGRFGSQKLLDIFPNSVRVRETSTPCPSGRVAIGFGTGSGEQDYWLHCGELTVTRQ